MAAIVAMKFRRDAAPKSMSHLAASRPSGRCREDRNTRVMNAMHRDGRARRQTTADDLWMRPVMG